MKIAIVTIKSWNIANAQKCIKKSIHDCLLITEKTLLSEDSIKKFQPDYIFFPHWSWIIPESIYSNYKCIVFHMTDLPYGRGGSPLQNLICRGHKETKISAIQVTQELDAGPVYLKENLDLSGSAEEIFKRASSIIFESMIPTIIEKKLTPMEQCGEITTFKRRQKEESNIADLENINEVYDYIRMLDAEGYPKAFVKQKKYQIEFFDASLENNEVIAKVRITGVK
jgi:methionyl-tRNA formyltransferase